MLKPIALTLTAAILLAACEPTPEYEAKQEQKANVFDAPPTKKIPNPDGTWMLWRVDIMYVTVDPVTGCHYLLFNRKTVTPRLNADGSPYCEGVPQ